MMGQNQAKNIKIKCERRMINTRHLEETKLERFSGTRHVEKSENVDRTVYNSFSRLG